MVAKILGAQRDFSYGQVDISLKRQDDHPARKAGLRQMVNARILNATSLQNRSGRSALYPISNQCARNEEFSLTSGTIWKIAFGPARIQIINAAGAVVQQFTAQGNGAALPWNALNLDIIVWAIFRNSIYITFQGMRPQIVTFDGVSTWSIADYNESVVGVQKRTPFYRLSPQDVTMLPSATTGNITIKFSQAILVPGMIGTRMRFGGRQLQITGVTDPQNGTATVIETLPPAQQLTLSSPAGSFAIGDVIVGAISGSTGILTTNTSQQTITYFVGGGPVYPIGSTLTGATSGATGVVISTIFYNGGETVVLSLNTPTLFQAGEVISGPGGNHNIVNAGGSNIVVQLLQKENGGAPGFTNSEKIVGPSGSATISGVTTIVPQAVSVWDDEVMNDYRGYPASCFVDQFRLGFCDFPALPNGICWSAINSPNDLYANDASSPSNAIFELCPEKVRVFYVVPGMESSEFVFCDRKLYYIPITATNPLIPGSVAFQILSSDGCAQVQPRSAQEVLLYVNAGRNSIIGITAPGAYNRPFNTNNLTEFHSALFNDVQAIAVPTADGTFNERYVYVLNGNGTLVVGKYKSQNGNIQGGVGWGPWNGVGSVTWVAAFQSGVIFSSVYFGVPICEILDDNLYLDCALFVNNMPAAFTPPGGKGPLWFIPSQTVNLMDQSTRSMGTYQIDANGFIVPQNNGGEDLTASSLVAGQQWTMITEPFCPDANPGQDVGQRMFRRRVSRFAAYVVNSTGFLMARLFSGPITPTSPALGTIMNTYRVTAYNQGDDATKPPPLRETAERWRPLGRSFDPRVAIIKDTPGPLLIEELGMEATI